VGLELAGMNQQAYPTKDTATQTADVPASANLLNGPTLGQNDATNPGDTIVRRRSPSKCRSGFLKKVRQENETFMVCFIINMQRTKRVSLIFGARKFSKSVSNPTPMLHRRTTSS